MYCGSVVWNPKPRPLTVMANLPSDRLPDQFETVIHGTGQWSDYSATVFIYCHSLSGLTESILAAASARIGKSVLHIDRSVQ